MKKIAAFLLSGSFVGAMAAQTLSAQPSVDIEAVQKALQQQGYTIKAVNGVLDTSTKHALMTFQLDNNLPAEAQLDEETVSLLFKQQAAASAEADKVVEIAPDMMKGADATIAMGQQQVIELDAGELSSVRANAKSRLRQLGYDVHNLNDAIVSFQLDNDLPAEGQLDAQTLVVMGFGDAEKPAVAGQTPATLNVVENSAVLALPAFPGQPGAKIVGAPSSDIVTTAPSQKPAVVESKVAETKTPQPEAPQPPAAPQAKPKQIPESESPAPVAAEPEELVAEATAKETVKKADNVADNLQVMQSLQALGYDTGEPKTALKLFQLDQGLPAEGQLDNATAMALIDAVDAAEAAERAAQVKAQQAEPQMAKAKVTPKTTQPKPAAKKEAPKQAKPKAAKSKPRKSQPRQSKPQPEVDLIAVSERLNMLGYDIAKLNTAVKLFQLDNDIPAEGQLDEQTLAALFPAEPVPEEKPQLQPEPVLETPAEPQPEPLSEATEPEAPSALQAVADDALAAIPAQSDEQPQAPTLTTDEDYLQHLRALGYQVDSDREALVLFQLDNDIVAEGYLNATTKQAIAAAQPLAEPIVQPRNAEVDEDIQVQQAEELSDVDLDAVDAQLVALGYDVSDRRAALKLYQLDQGLPAEGQLDAKTLAALLNKPEEVIADDRYQVPEAPTTEDVLERLALHGYSIDESSLDSLSGTNRDALVLFQLDHDIPAEAQLDEVTVSTLFTKLIPAPAPPPLAENKPAEAQVADEQAAEDKDESTADADVAGNVDTKEVAAPAEPAASDDADNSEPQFAELAAVESQQVAALPPETLDVGPDGALPEGDNIADEAAAEAQTAETVSADASVEATNDDSAQFEEVPPTPVTTTAAPAAPVIVDEKIYKTEQRLVELEYLDAANGRWTAWDIRALTFFQLENMLTPSGELDAETEAALYSENALSDPQRSGSVKVSTVIIEPVIIAAAEAEPAAATEPAPTPEPVKAPEPNEVAATIATQEEQPQVEPVKEPSKAQAEEKINAPTTEVAQAPADGVGFLTAPANAGDMTNEDASALAAINAAGATNNVAAPKAIGTKDKSPELLETSPATRPATVVEANKPVPSVRPRKEKVIEPPKSLVADIELVQKRLQRAGFYDGDIDGKKGPKLTRATKYFQLINNIPATGELDQTTLKLLYRQEPFTRQ